MRNFDINQMPPSLADIDNTLSQRKDELYKFKRNVILITLAELSLMALAYIAAFILYDLGDHMGVALAVAAIGPTVAVLCIVITTSLRHKELSGRVSAYLSPESPDVSNGLQGRNDEVDLYLERLKEIGRDLTQTEAIKLERHCKIYG